MDMTATVGVLAIQGAFAEHVEAVRRASAKLPGCSVKVVEVRNAHDFDALDGLIIPGGESTTLNVFFRSQEGLFDRLRSWVKEGGTVPPGHERGRRRRRRKVLFGTCAGLIFLSDNVDHQKEGGQLRLGGLDVTTCRNFFGRQRRSFQQDVRLLFPATSPRRNGGGVPDNNYFPGVFIRAPGVLSVGAGARPLAAVRQRQRGEEEEEVVAAVAQDGEAAVLLATAFHPELTADDRFHALFLGAVAREIRREENEEDDMV